MFAISDYVPKKEFLELLDGTLKRTRLNDMLRQGELDAIQPGGPGGRYYIRRSEAERLLRPIKAQK